MLKNIWGIGLCLLLTSCSSTATYDLVNGKIEPNSEGITNEALCLSAFTSEVKNPSSRVQQKILNEITRRKITLEECSSYSVESAGGVDSFCSDFNHGYVKGESSRMISLGNFISLQDMLLVQQTLGINCNTQRFAQNYFSEEEQRSRAESRRVWNDAAQAWGRVLGSKF